MTNPLNIPAVAAAKAAFDAAARQALTIAKETKAAAALIFVAGVLSGCIVF